MSVRCGNHSGNPAPVYHLSVEEVRLCYDEPRAVEPLNWTDDDYERADAISMGEELVRINEDYWDDVRRGL